MNLEDLAKYAIGIIFASGFYWGLTKSKLSEISNSVKNLNNFHMDATSKFATQIEKVAAFEHRIEVMEDRLDVHDKAIHDLEITTAKWSS